MGFFGLNIDFWHCVWTAASEAAAFSLYFHGHFHPSLADHDSVNDNPSPLLLARKRGKCQITYSYTYHIFTRLLKRNFWSIM